MKGKLENQRETYLLGSKIQAVMLLVVLFLYATCFFYNVESNIDFYYIISCCFFSYYIMDARQPHCFQSLCNPLWFNMQFPFRVMNGIMGRCLKKYVASDKEEKTERFRIAKSISKYSYLHNRCYKIRTMAMDRDQNTFKIHSDISGTVQGCYRNHNRWITPNPYPGTMVKHRLRQTVMPNKALCSLAEEVYWSLKELSSNVLYEKYSVCLLLFNVLGRLM